MLRIVLFLCVIALAGCDTTTKITNAWVAPDLKEKNLKGVLVIAVTERQDARINFEDAYTAALKDQGIHAVASHALVNGTARKTSKDKIIAAAKQAGLDTLLLSHYAGTLEQPVYHPGTDYYSVIPAYGSNYGYGRFGGYYGQIVKVGSTAGIWTSSKQVMLVSDLYETATEEPLWQATSETIDPSNRIKLRDSVIQSFVGQMEKQGLIKK